MNDCACCDLFIRVLKTDVNFRSSRTWFGGSICTCSFTYTQRDRCANIVWNWWILMCR